MGRGERAVCIKWATEPSPVTRGSAKGLCLDGGPGVPGLCCPMAIKARVHSVPWWIVLEAVGHSESLGQPRGFRVPG